MAPQSATRSAQSITQQLRNRGADATRHLREALHLPSDSNDLAILGTAVAEEAAQECRRNLQFADGVRRRYDEMMVQRGNKSRSASAKAPKQELPPLVPIGHLRPGERIVVDPFSPPDPKFLIRVYGHPQLGRALQDYTLDMLKQTAAQTAAQHPGTKPANRSKKDALIAYIVEYSTKE